MKTIGNVLFLILYMTLYFVIMFVALGLALLICQGLLYLCGKAAPRIQQYMANRSMFGKKGAKFTIV